VSVILNIKIKVLFREEVAPNIFLIKLSAPSITPEALPGQFIHIKCGKDTYQVMRRPISIHKIDKKKGEIYILFQVVGENTKLLAQRVVGDYLDILGPLGNGFNLLTKSKKMIVVGGGIGVAPLLALVEECLIQGK
jgi:dihydroorotate dehydrogenase electron transfer subunit